MSPTSAGGGTNTKTGGEHISHLVETLAIFLPRQACEIINLLPFPSWLTQDSCQP